MTLEGLTAIAEELDVSPKRVKSLRRAGAPIVRYGEGQSTRYLADLRELRAWREAHKADLGIVRQSSA